MKTLAGVTFYKVGHHGSRNATPRTLWNGFTNRSKQQKPTRLRTVVSTMAGKFGKAATHTEVPRATLVTALNDETDFFTTQQLTQKGDTLKRTFEISF
jgi:membrane-bound lytic murein transglycosylase B